MVKELAEGLKMLRPPPREITDEHTYAWQWSVSVITGVTAVALTLHILMACGLLTSVYPGFASAGDVQEIRTQLAQARVVDLQGRILSMRALHCSSGNPTLKALYLDTLQKTIIEYEKIARERFPLPDCKEF